MEMHDTGEMRLVFSKKDAKVRVSLRSENATHGEEMVVLDVLVVGAAGMTPAEILHGACARAIKIIESAPSSK